jgi:hypothetical protein
MRLWVAMLSGLIGAGCGKGGESSEPGVRCEDGSSEAKCNEPTDSGTHSGAGGARSTDGGAGGTGGRVSPGTAAGAVALCQAMAAHEVAACPDASLDPDVEAKACQRATLDYAPEGCGPAWEAYLACAAEAPIDCNQGPLGCDAQQNDYRACDQHFASATLCSRSSSEDHLCPTATPFAFGCLAPIPTGCLPLMTGAADFGACCPIFLPP